MLKWRIIQQLENILKLVKSSLIKHGGIDDTTIVQKLVCVGVDGALRMQGHKNGLVTKLKDFYYFFASYIVGIHYMAHRINLAFRIVKNYFQIHRF